MRLLRIVFGIAIIGLGIYGGKTIAEGLDKGEILRFAKHGNTSVRRSQEPERFWIAVGFWSIGSLMLVGGGLVTLNNNL